MKNLTQKALLGYALELQHEANNCAAMNNCCIINSPETNDIKRHINLMMAKIIEIIVIAETSEIDYTKETIHE